MLFDYAILTNRFDVGFFDVEDANNFDIIVPLNRELLDAKSSVFRALSCYSEQSFCFSISAELLEYDRKYLKDQIIQSLVGLLFLPNYIRENGKHIFFTDINGSVQEKFAAQKIYFHNELKKQGIDTVEIKIVNSDVFAECPMNEQDICFIHPQLDDYLNSDKQGFVAFSKTFATPAHFEKKRIVTVSDPIDFINKRRQIKKFENWLTLENPLHARLIEMYKLANQERNALKSENKLLKFQLENNTYYLKLIREESQRFIEEVRILRLEIHRLSTGGSPSSNDFLKQDVATDHTREYIKQLQTVIIAEQARASDTLEWYKKEYEILPMWYKRFGHIIKVFLGKRKFKSLFK